MSGCGVVCGCETISASSPRDGGAATAARPVGAHAGPGCPGGGAFASCDDMRCRLALSCRASACAFGPTWEDQVDMGCTWRCAEAVGSSPQITSTQPGDQSPCLPCLSMQTTVVCVGACVPAFVRVRAYARVWVCAMLVCRRQRGCGGGCMGASVCVRTCMLGRIAATVPELACSHDKRCTPNLSGGARRSDSRLRPSGWLFHVAEVCMGSLLRIVLCMPSGVRSSA
jgi:hypothetical protein